MQSENVQTPRSVS